MLEDLNTFCGRINARLEDATFDEKQAILQLLIERIIGGEHSASPSVLTRSILHTLPASTIPVAGSTQRPSPKETMLTTEDTPLSRLHTSSRLIDTNSYVYVSYVGAYV